jgi:hypothetical protein
MSTESKTIAVHTATVKNKEPTPTVYRLSGCLTGHSNRSVRLSFLPLHQALMHYSTRASAYLSQRQSKHRKDWHDSCFFVVANEQVKSRNFDVPTWCLSRASRSFLPRQSKGHQVGPHLFLLDASRERQSQSKMRHISILMIYKVKYHSEDSQPASQPFHSPTCLQQLRSGGVESARERGMAISFSLVRTMRHFCIRACGTYGLREFER